MTSQVNSIRRVIRYTAERIPRIGTSGTKGVLKGLSICGWRTRKTQTPADTMVKASSVPMLTSSDSTSILKNAGMIAANDPNTIVVIQGVRNFGCTAEAHFGSRPSLDIE